MMKIYIKKDDEKEATGIETNRCVAVISPSTGLLPTKGTYNLKIKKLKLRLCTNL